MRGSSALHAQLHPSAMCCVDSARGWDSLTSSTRPFYLLDDGDSEDVYREGALRLIRRYETEVGGSS